MTKKPVLVVHNGTGNTGNQIVNHTKQQKTRNMSNEETPLYPAGVIETPQVNRKDELEVLREAEEANDILLPPEFNVMLANPSKKDKPDNEDETPLYPPGINPDDDCKDCD